MAVVSDGGYNVVKAVKDGFGPEKQITCFAHTLNRIVVCGLTGPRKTKANPSLNERSNDHVEVNNENDNDNEMEEEESAELLALSELLVKNNKVPLTDK